MATSAESCENSAQTNVDFETTESDTELQNIFRKLRVNRRPKKVQRCVKTKSGTTNSGRLPEKQKRRKIVKDASFIFTSTFNKSESKTDKEIVKDNEKSSSQNYLQRGLSSLTPPSNECQRVRGCGEEFRQASIVKVSDSLNMDDTTPEELAAYFDQLLHIPKPMSQMAEMMYT